MPALRQLVQPGCAETANNAPRSCVSVSLGSPHWFSRLQSLMSDFGNGATIGRAVLGMCGIDTIFDDNVAIANHGIRPKCTLSSCFWSGFHRNVNSQDSPPLRTLRRLCAERPPPESEE